MKKDSLGSLLQVCGPYFKFTERTSPSSFIAQDDQRKLYVHHISPENMTVGSVNVEVLEHRLAAHDNDSRYLPVVDLEKAIKDRLTYSQVGGVGTVSPDQAFSIHLAFLPFFQQKTVLATNALRFDEYLNSRTNIPFSLSRIKSGPFTKGHHQWFNLREEARYQLTSDGIVLMESEPKVTPDNEADEVAEFFTLGGRELYTDLWDRPHRTFVRIPF